MKRILAIVLLIMVIFTSLPMEGLATDKSTIDSNDVIAVGTSEYNIVMGTDQPYNYLYYEEDGGYYLYEYKGNETVVNVPETIDGNPIMGIWDNCFTGNQCVTEINIPAAITTISASGLPFEGCSNLKNIFVDKHNTNYSDINGVLFRSSVLLSNGVEYNLLLKYPEGRTETSYRIPLVTKSIISYSFKNVMNLKAIIIPDTTIASDHTLSISNQAFVGFAGTLVLCTSDPSKISFSVLYGGSFNTMSKSATIVTKNAAMKVAVENNFKYLNYYPEYNTYPSTVIDASASGNESFNIRSTTPGGLTFSDGSTVKNLTLLVGQSYDVGADIVQYPADTLENITWTDKNGKLVSSKSFKTCTKIIADLYTSNGVYTHNDVLTGTDESGNQITVNLNVYIPVEDFGDNEVTENETIPYKRQTAELSVKVTPQGASTRNVQWECSNDKVLKIAEIDNSGNDYKSCYFDILSAGQVTVTATLDDRTTLTDGTQAGKLWKKEYVITITPIEIDDFTIEEILTQEYTGSAVKPEIIVKNDKKTLVNGEDYTVSYSNNVDAGYATVTVTAVEGSNYTGSMVTGFNIMKSDVSNAGVTAGTADASGCYKEEAIQVTQNGRTLTKDVDYTLTRTAISKDGVGSYTITGKGNYTGTKTATFKLVTAKIDMSKAAISGISNMDYTGRAITFPKMTVKVNGVTLASKADYTVTYQDNTDAGTAKVIIEATANSIYTGSITKTFKISKLTMNPNVTAYKGVYDGKSHNAVTVSGVPSGSKITYKVNSGSYKTTKPTVKAAGVTKVTARITNSKYNTYEKTCTITINPKKAAISSLASKKAAQLTVKWKKDTAITGYQIQYSTSSKFTSKTTKTVEIKKNSTITKTITKLTKGKRYNVRIRAYKTVKVDGKNVITYGSWSSVKNVTVKKK